MIKHPFNQAVVLLVGSWVFFKFVIPLLPGSAPVPASVIFQYTAIALVGIDDEGHDPGQYLLGLLSLGLQ